MLQSLKLLGRPALRGAMSLSSTAPAAERDGLLDLVSNIQRDFTPHPEKAKVPTNNAQLKNILTEVKTKGTVLGHEFMGFLHSSLENPNDPNIKAVVDAIAVNEQIKQLDYDDCVFALSLLAKLRLHTSPVFQEIVKKLEGMDKEAPLSAAKILSAVTSAKAVNCELPKKILEMFSHAVENQFRSLKVREVLSAFSHLSLTPSLKLKLIEQSRSLIHIMSCGEVISLLRHLSSLGLREKSIFQPAAQIITSHKERLTLNSIVDLAHICAKTKFHDKRLLRRLTLDLSGEIVYMTSWFDATSLIVSFGRIGLDHPQIWKALSSWINVRISEFNKQSFSTIKNIAFSFAAVGIEGTDEIGDVLAKKLSSDRTRDLLSPEDWFEAIYCLALYDKLTLTLGETVLNKLYIDDLFKTAKSETHKILNACKLLQIQTSLLQKHGESYKGKKITKETFGSLLTSKDAIRCLLSMKYGESYQSNIDALFTTGFHLLAPKGNFESGRVDERGYYWDSAFSLDKNHRFIPTNTWTTETKLRPVVLIDWKQRKKTIDLGLNRPSEANLMGKERMMLRHLRGAGFDPIVIFMSDLISFSSQDEKNKFLKTITNVKYLTDAK